MKTPPAAPHPEWPPRLDLAQVETPCYVIDLGALEANCAQLGDVQRRAGCRILLALKGFAPWSVFPLARRYLAGVSASSLHEARLGKEHFGGELHVYAPAFTDGDFPDIARIADHIVFNSFAQWTRFRPEVERTNASRSTPSGAMAADPRPVSCGIRVNPEHSEVDVPLYDPCAPGSRLGVTRAVFEAEVAATKGRCLEALEGLHFHTLCELDSDALERTLAAFEARFGPWIARARWVNMGGGHHITRPGYDLERLVRVVRAFRERHRVEVYLEPGEAVAIGTGVLVASVLDVVPNGVETAILDTSFTAHMPDVLETPYRPNILGAAAPGDLPHTYRLGGLTCLAGDVVGDYSFAEPLRIGRKLVFLDMSHYTMVKNTTFNGVRLPSIATRDPASGDVTIVRRFGYEDYRDRLS
jgi:carboxynorspermidine decarboxylase